MKKTLLLSFLFCVFTSQAQIINFSDPNFKAAVLQAQPSVDTNSDGEVQVSEAMAVFSLTVYGNYTNTDGLQEFRNLNELHLQSAYNLPFLDVSMLNQLFILDIGYSGVSMLNVNGLTYLNTINCSGCFNLLNLDVSSNINLQNLYCVSTNVTSLNLSANTNLQMLDCSDNHVLTSINLTGLTNLAGLNLAGCYQLASLNVSGLTNLRSLNCFDCVALTSLDVSNLSNLEILDFPGCRLSDVNFSGANNIKKIDCSSNGLTNLNISNLTHLEQLNCSFNALTTLNLSGLNSIVGLDCSDNLLTSLNVSNLTNLINLQCGYNQIASLDVSNLVNLQFFNCTSNQLTVLNVAPLVNLNSLMCDQNQLANLNLNTLTQLNQLECSSNPLTSLDVSALDNLSHLSCQFNNLTSLDISHNLNLEYLNCGYNQLNDIDLQGLSQLNSFDGSGNLFTELDFSNCGTGSMGLYVIFHALNNLEYVNFKNGEENSVFFDIGQCPELRYICANESNIASIMDRLEYNNVENVQVNSYCSFVPSGPYNTITGILNFDVTNNGCGTDDILMPGTKLFINDGTHNGAAFSNQAGNYSFYTQDGNFVITPNIESPYYTVIPASATINFSNNNNNNQVQNFCVTALGVHKDLDIVIIPVDGPRPGFDTSYRLVYKNKGNQTLSGTVNFNFNDAVLDLVSATPMASSETLNNLNWDFTDLMPFESREISFTLNVNSPMETPAVNLDDVLNFTAFISPTADDETLTDNTHSLSQIVIGSYDPNDKTCLEGNTITPAMVGNYLNYLIRFQNSGTAAAENVVVKDVLDDSKFDISSFQLTGSSHPQVTRINGNKVEFIFEHINLPAEMDDEPGSHGFVAFKIKTKNNLVLGNVVENTADIYFDFNFPIVTNTTSTTVSVLDVSHFDSNTVSVTPIPVREILQIKALEAITSIQLFDIQGRLLQTKNPDNANSTLDFSGKANGIYVVKIHTEKGMKVQKVIKE